MKLRPTLLLLFLLLPVSVLGQGVRMSPDFFPLEVGNRWIYDLYDETGGKAGTLEFEVEDFRIVEGSSFYVLTEFPFTLETGSRIRLVRYDRQERQFMRVVGTDEGPLFLSDGASTEVVQVDAAGSPQKFVLKKDTLILTFERGVGIVEARIPMSTGTRLAKLSAMQHKGVTRGGTPAPAVSSAVTPSPSVAGIPGPQAAPPQTARGVEAVTAVTETNPRLDIFSLESGSSLKFVFVVENILDKLLPFKFSSGQSYDFLIIDPTSDREVWRWSRGQSFTQVLRSEAIRGSAKWTFEVLWNGRDNDGKPLPPGQYHLIGTLTSNPPIQSSRAILTIR